MKTSKNTQTLAIKKIFLLIYMIQVSFILIPYQKIQAMYDFVPLQERALGQSLTGATLLNDSLFSNPASSVFIQSYSIDGTYNLPKSFSVSVLDTRTSNIGGALGYFQETFNSSSMPKQGAKVSVMNQVVSQVFGLAAAGKIIWGPDQNQNQTNYKDLDIGFLIKASFLQIGGTLRNVFGGLSVLNENREIQLGIRFNYDDILFISLTSQSLYSTPTPYQYGAGFEFITPYYFSLKGGARYLSSQNTYLWSVGTSILAPKIAIHYAANFGSSTDPSTIEHTIGTTFLF